MNLKFDEPVFSVSGAFIAKEMCKRGAELITCKWLEKNNKFRYYFVKNDNTLNIFDEVKKLDRR